ncbi:MAG: transcriptional regulator [Phycisphaera sp.]|nr:transcriptional regulator [Phycisphaera sp.]
MDELTFQRKMQELLNRIKEMPEGTESAEAASGVEQATERRERIKASVAELQESLDYLRLSVKYLVFDLEATRRENAYLRRMLEQSSRDAQRELEEGDEGPFGEE